MAFDTFDEGINLGGIRSKNEIRTLICYIFCTLKRPLSKETVINALQEKGLANYFESTACFDDLVKGKNIKKTDEDENLFEITDQGKLISNQLEDTLALTVKERAVECTLSLLEKERLEKEHSVTIEKCENGYRLNCSISGGDMELLSFSLYVPDINQARLLRKNFRKNPESFYSVIIAMMTRDKASVEDILDELNSIL
ncbi:MAG: DUF4364 family protein [Oscillospiraceae bacterium]|nr:DUF4364 family protein [Candidatus Ruminococcus equi]